MSLHAASNMRKHKHLRGSLPLPTDLYSRIRVGNETSLHPGNEVCNEYGFCLLPGDEAVMMRHSSSLLTAVEYGHRGRLIRVC